MTTTIHWEYLAECLRGELADYGGLLHLFETQQRALFDRDASVVLQLAHEIENHAQALALSRTIREEAVAAFAVENDQPAASSLRSLLPFIESAARPLIEALINEVNALLHRVRRTSRHNHSVLARTVETHQETLSLLRPNSFTKTYSPGGRVSVATAHSATTLRAAG